MYRGRGASGALQGGRDGRVGSVRWHARLLDTRNCQGGEGYKIAHLNIRGSDESKTRCPRLASTAQCVFEGTLVVNMWTQLSIVIECVLVPPDLQPGSYSD